MRVATLIWIISCVTAAGAAAEPFPLVSLIFEYTVAPDGTRQDIKIVKIEQPVTHTDLSSALTKAEKSRGVRNVGKRKRLAAKDVGRKLYEIAIFDLRSRKYISDE